MIEDGIMGIGWRAKVCTERRDGRKRRYAHTRWIGKYVDESIRRNAEWKTDVGEGCFIMARHGSRAAKMIEDENGRAGTEARLCDW